MGMRSKAKDSIVIDVHGGATSESWLVVYKDGRVQQHTENDGWRFVNRGPEAHDEWLDAEGVAKLGKRHGDTQTFTEQVAEAVKLLNQEEEEEEQRCCVAHCERCDERWLVPTGMAPELLEGVCPDCNGDTDVERPLTFREAAADDLLLNWPELPQFAYSK
jgi:hypothetical protein